MPRFLGDDPVMKSEEFRLLRDLIGARLGIALPHDGAPQLTRRLRERLAVLNLATFAEYHQYLRFHPLAQVEWDEAVEQLTTNETYFFRQEFQLRAFRDEVLPLLAEENASRRNLAVWSAGCSTGEEAYTIAMLISDSGMFAGWDVRVFGSDISKRCVAAARRGVYGASSFRAMGSHEKNRHFVERVDGSAISEKIRSMCHFGQMNLLDEERSRIFGRVDAIFCRNVLIYLDTHARRRVIDNFHDRLYPGGVLLLGHSESLLNVSTAFELLHLKEDLAYRKPASSFGGER
jgi:chemotaxis protein methyltransferase CheR